MQLISCSKYSSGSTGAVNATGHAVPADSCKRGGSSNTHAGTKKKAVNNHISAATFNEKNAVIFIAAAFLGGNSEMGRVFPHQRFGLVYSPQKKKRKECCQGTCVLDCPFQELGKGWTLQECPKMKSSLECDAELTHSSQPSGEPLSGETVIVGRCVSFEGRFWLTASFNTQPFKCDERRKGANPD